MIIAKRLKGKAIAAWLGPTGDAARRALTRARQRITSADSKLDFYVDIADPMSYLTAQAVARLVETYRVPFEVHVITPPASDVDPSPGLRSKNAVRDAQLVAQYWDLEFPGQREAEPGVLRDVGTGLVRTRPGAEQLRAVLDLCGAMWRGDKKTLGTLLLKHGSESSGQVAPILNANYAELRKAGHYQGAMIHYAGTWYWGIDRLPYLEAALAAELGAPGSPSILTPRSDAERGPLKLSEKPLACELWFSFHSPYSYLALEQIEDVLAPHVVPLVAKPVAPSTGRGGTVPLVKRMYVVHDVKREADRLGIPFGELCEPLGKGVENCLHIAHWASQRGQLMAFARSAMRGIWAEALDVAEYVDLRHIVERAGLPWEEARAAIGGAEAQKAALANAAELAVYSLRGVPSIRCGDFLAWGQDRLPLLADRLRRHALAVTSPPPDGNATDA